MESRYIVFKGKHSIVSIFKEGDLVLVKKQFLSSEFKANFFKELLAYKKLSYYSFIPRLFSYNENEFFLILEYIEGINLKDLIKKIKITNHINKEDKRKVFFNLMLKIYKVLIKICIVLDIEGVFKDEWNRPFKHVIFKFNENRDLVGIYIIDFDRSVLNKNLKNLPQFLTFIFNNLGFNNYFYLLRDIIKYYREVFGNYLSFKKSSFPLFFK